MRWGFALVPGPLFPAWAAFTTAGVALALGDWVLSYRTVRTQVGRGTTFHVRLPRGERG